MQKWCGWHLVAYSDYHIRNESIPNKSLEYRELESGSIYVDCKTWTFGEIAKIKLKPVQQENFIQPIKFSVSKADTGSG